MRKYKGKLAVGLTSFILTWVFVTLIKSLESASNWYFSIIEAIFPNFSYLQNYMFNASLVLFFGVIVPALFIMQIKCKSCGHKFLFDIYNRKPGPDGVAEISSLTKCPKCNSEL